MFDTSAAVLYLTYVSSAPIRPGLVAHASIASVALALSCRCPAHPASPPFHCCHHSSSNSFSINTIRRHSLLSYSLHYLPNTIQSIHKSISLPDPNRALDDVDLTTTHAYLSSRADLPLTALNFSTQRSKCRRYSSDRSIALMNRGRVQAIDPATNKANKAYRVQTPRLRVSLGLLVVCPRRQAQRQ